MSDIIQPKPEGDGITDDTEAIQIGYDLASGADVTLHRTQLPAYILCPSCHGRVYSVLTMGKNGYLATIECGDCPYRRVL